jgi:hypothetical protein
MKDRSAQVKKEDCREEWLVWAGLTFYRFRRVHFVQFSTLEKATRSLSQSWQLPSTVGRPPCQDMRRSRNSNSVSRLLRLLSRPLNRPNRTRRTPTWTLKPISDADQGRTKPILPLLSLQTDFLVPHLHSCFVPIFCLTLRSLPA